MADFFQQHNRKKALKDKLYFYSFYTVLLFLFALMIVLISKDNQICLFDFYCISSKQHWLQAAFILYLYLLIAVIILIQTYKLLEKLVAKKNHIRYFKFIFISITPLVVLIIGLTSSFDYNTYMLIVFAGILSIAGLLMIEFRKK